MRRGDTRLWAGVVERKFFAFRGDFINQFKFVWIACKQLFCLAHFYWNLRENLPVPQVLPHRFLEEGKLDIRNLFRSKIYVVIKAVVYRRTKSEFRVLMAFQNSLRQKM